MQSKVNEAAKRKNCGYNCAQAVACTYCDMAGIDEETAKNLTQGFAAGIGGSMEEMCIRDRCYRYRWHTPDYKRSFTC